MRHRSVDILLSFFCMSVIICVSACRSSRGSSHETVDSPAAMVAVAPSGGGVEAVYSDSAVSGLIDSYRSWSDVSMNVRCSLVSPKNMTISGKAVMIRDKEIRLSFRMLGFEVAGMYIDNDSLLFYEKMNRTMVVESMKKLKDTSGLDLSDIQDILLGRIVCPGGDVNSGNIFDLYRMSVEDTDIILTPRSSIVPWHYILSAIPQLALVGIDIDVPGRGNAECRYAGSLITEAGPVSPMVEISAVFGKQSVKASLQWSLETAVWNQGLDPVRKIPDNYLRIPFANLVKSLGT